MSRWPRFTTMSCSLFPPSSSSYNSPPTVMNGALTRAAPSMEPFGSHILTCMRRLHSACPVWSPSEGNYSRLSHITTECIREGRRRRPVGSQRREEANKAERKEGRAEAQEDLAPKRKSRGGKMENKDRNRQKSRRRRAADGDKYFRWISIYRRS